MRDKGTFQEEHRVRQILPPDDVDLSPLPLSYGIDRLVLMVRDPSWAHAYWEVGVARITETSALLGGGKAFLRLVEPSTELWIPQIPSVTNAIEISDMRKGTGGWVTKATGK